MTSEHAHRRSYGRTKARALKPRQQALVETLLPRLALPEEGPLPPASVLEIGFGGGEHLAAQARASPERAFIGAEPFLNGVASCLRHIEEQALANVRLYHGDVRDILPRIPDASLDRADILFPDPWPKARHHKRRLIQPDFLAALARVLRPGGELRFATDWQDYAAWTLFHAQRTPALAWTAERAADWRAPWPGHTPTRYEIKRLGDCAPVYLRFNRIALR